MVSNKKGVVRFLMWLKSLGVQKYVICPGSRNAPLIHTISSLEDIEIISIPDERVAGFYALGWAESTDSIVGVVTTSGSAVVNLSGALVEAFYRHIPVLALTADRPDHLIDQGDGQTMRQRKVFRNFTVDSFHLNLEEVIPDWKTVYATIAMKSGPVHINLPLEEPLYDLVPLDSNLHIPKYELGNVNAPIHWDEIQNIIDKAKDIWIIVGQRRKNLIEEKLLSQIAQNSRVTIIGDHLANVHIYGIIQVLDPLFKNLRTKDVNIPDVIVHIGGAILSKQMKIFLRENKPQYALTVHPYSWPDVFQSQSHAIKCTSVEFFASINWGNNINANDAKLKSIELRMKQDVSSRIAKFGWCDLKIFEYLSQNLKYSKLHLANSSAVRYGGFFTWDSSVEILGNRGVSGIDGCTCTALAWGQNAEMPNVLVTGDVAFFYDSNAFWVNPMPGNVLVIVLNNSSGNIFDFISEPNISQKQMDLQRTPHQLSAQHVANLYSIEYVKIESMEQLHKEFESYFSKEYKDVRIFEVFTNPKINTITYKSLFNKIGE